MKRLAFIAFIAITIHSAAFAQSSGAPDASWQMLYCDHYAPYCSNGGTPWLAPDTAYVYTLDNRSGIANQYRFYYRLFNGAGEFRIEYQDSNGNWLLGSRATGANVHDEDLFYTSYTTDRPVRFVVQVTSIGQYFLPGSGYLAIPGYMITMLQGDPPTPSPYPTRTVSLPPGCRFERIFAPTTEIQFLAPARIYSLEQGREVEWESWGPGDGNWVQLGVYPNETARVNGGYRERFRPLVERAQGDLLICDEPPTPTTSTTPTPPQPPAQCFTSSGQTVDPGSFYPRALWISVPAGISIRPGADGVPGVNLYRSASFEHWRWRAIDYESGIVMYPNTGGYQQYWQATDYFTIGVPATELYWHSYSDPAYTIEMCPPLDPTPTATTTPTATGTATATPTGTPATPTPTLPPTRTALPTWTPAPTPSTTLTPSTTSTPTATPTPGFHLSCPVKNIWTVPVTPTTTVRLYDGQQLEVLDAPVEITVSGQSFWLVPGPLYTWQFGTGDYAVHAGQEPGIPARVAACAPLGAATLTPLPTATPTTGLRTPTPGAGPSPTTCNVCALQQTIAAGIATMAAVRSPTPATPTSTATATPAIPRVRVEKTVWQVREAAGFASISLVLSQPAPSAVSVEWSTLTGSAVDLLDFVPWRETITFAPGETVKTVQIVIIDDDTWESEETFTIVLANPAGAVLDDFASATIQILDDDQPPTPTLAPGTATPTLAAMPPTAVCGVTPTLPPTNGSPMPEIALTLPTMRPMPTYPVTATIVISGVTEMLGMVQTVQIALETPLAGVEQVGVNFSYQRGEALGKTVVANVEPGMEWVALASPAHPAWQQEGGPLWAIEPIFGPILIPIGVALLIMVVSFLLSIASWVMKLVDLILKAIELIPGE